MKSRRGCRLCGTIRITATVLGCVIGLHVRAEETKALSSTSTAVDGRDDAHDSYLRELSERFRLRQLSGGEEEFVKRFDDGTLIPHHVEPEDTETLGQDVEISEDDEKTQADESSSAASRNTESDKKDAKERKLNAKGGPPFSKLKRLAPGRFDLRHLSYVHPRPYAYFTSAATTVAVRPTGIGQLRLDSIRDRIMVFTPSPSGGPNTFRRKAGVVHLAKDRQTLIWEPLDMFTPGQKVVVRVKGGLKTLSGHTFSTPVEWNFVISPRDQTKYLPLQKSHLKRHLADRPPGQGDGQGGGGSNYLQQQFGGGFGEDIIAALLEEEEVMRKLNSLIEEKDVEDKKNDSEAREQNSASSLALERNDSVDAVAGGETEDEKQEREMFESMPPPPPFSSLLKEWSHPDQSLFSASSEELSPSDGVMLSSLSNHTHTQDGADVDVSGGEGYALATPEVSTLKPSDPDVTPDWDAKEWRTFDVSLLNDGNTFPFLKAGKDIKQRRKSLANSFFRPLSKRQSSLLHRFPTRHFRTIPLSFPHPEVLKSGNPKDIQKGTLSFSSILGGFTSPPGSSKKPMLVALSNAGQPQFYRSFEVNARQRVFRYSGKKRDTMIYYDRYAHRDSRFPKNQRFAREWREMNHYGHLVRRFRAGHGYQPDQHDFDVDSYGRYVVGIYDTQVLNLRGHIDKNGKPVKNGGKGHPDQLSKAEEETLEKVQVVLTIVQVLDSNGDVVTQWSASDEWAMPDLVAATADWRARILRHVQDRLIDVTHFNAASMSDNGSTVISMRPLGVLKLDRNGEREWMVGGAARHAPFHTMKVRGSTTQPAFAYQHNAHLSRPDHLIMFDNHGFELSGKMSQAIEYKLVPDQTGKNGAAASSKRAIAEARPVWNFRSTQNYGFAMGSANVLHETNNVGINWGAAGLKRSPFWTEVKRSKEGNNEVVLEMRFAKRDAAYQTHKQEFWWQTHRLPAVVLRSAKRDGSPQAAPTLHFAWNGATNVKGWRVYGGPTSPPRNLIYEGRKTRYEQHAALFPAVYDASNCQSGKKCFFRIAPILLNGKNGIPSRVISAVLSRVTTSPGGKKKKIVMRKPATSNVSKLKSKDMTRGISDEEEKASNSVEDGADLDANIGDEQTLQQQDDEHMNLETGSVEEHCFEEDVTYDYFDVPDNVEPPQHRAAAKADNRVDAVDDGEELERESVPSETSTEEQKEKSRKRNEKRKSKTKNLRVSSAAECQLLCETHDLCQFFTYRPVPAGICELKLFDGGRRHAVDTIGSISGPRSCQKLERRTRN